MMGWKVLERQKNTAISALLRYFAVKNHKNKMPLFKTIIREYKRTITHILFIFVSLVMARQDIRRLPLFWRNTKLQNKETLKIMKSLKCAM